MATLSDMLLRGLIESTQHPHTARPRPYFSTASAFFLLYLLAPAHKKRPVEGALPGFELSA